MISKWHIKLTWSLHCLVGFINILYLCSSQAQKVQIFLHTFFGSSLWISSHFQPSPWFHMSATLVSTSRAHSTWLTISIRCLSKFHLSGKNIALFIPLKINHVHCLSIGKALDDTLPRIWGSDFWYNPFDDHFISSIFCRQNFGPHCIFVFDWPPT